MAHVVADAVLIRCNDGLGQPTTYVNTAIGLNNGVMAVITGRLGLDGTKTIAGDTAIATWYEDLLEDGDGDFLPSRNADMVDGGCLESVSSMSFTLLNTNQIAGILESNGVQLWRCEVIYFRVMTSDNITFTFEQRWFGVIDDQPFTEISQKIQCVSSDKKNYKSAPQVPVNASTFPKAPSDSLDRYVPLAFGRVGYAPLVSVKGSGEKTILNVLSGVSYTISPANSLVSNVCNLKTKGVNFQDKDPRLTGKYLSVISGGIAQMILITLNYATQPIYAPTDPLFSDPSDWYTSLVLEEVPDLATPFRAWSSSPVSSGDPETWFFEVVDASPTMLLSTGRVSEVKANAQGRPSLSTYSKDTNAFVDVSEMNIKADASNIDATGFPGYSVASKVADQSGDLINFFTINPKDIKVSALSSWGSEDVPAIGSSAPLLFDKQEGAGHYYTLLTASTGSVPLEFDVYLPPAGALKQFEDLFCLFDLSMKTGAGVFSVDVSVTVTAFDIFGRQSYVLVNDVSVLSAGLNTTFKDYNLLPRSYFGLAGDAVVDATYYAKRGLMSLGALLGGSKAGNIYNRIRIRFNFLAGPDGTLTYQVRMKEIGLVGKIKVSTGSDSLYGSTVGETFGSTWNGRKTATDPLRMPHEFIEKVLRDYNTNSDLWVSDKIRRKGDRVRASTDNGHIFTCTTPGASGTSEPTWTTTTGATYTDGAAVWTETGTVPIQEGSFDALNALYFNWLAGYSMTEPKPTEEWVKILCRHAWIIAITDRYGKIKVKNWLDSISPIAAFDKSNIYKNSLKGGIGYSALSRSYNTLRFSYDWNPATKKNNRQIAIQNVDKPAFPSSTEPASDGVSLGAFTATALFSFDFTNPTWTLTLVTTTPHGRVSGDPISLSGNTAGLNFPVTSGGQVSVIDANTIKVSYLTTLVPTGTGSDSSGILRWHDTFRLKWKDYVSGIDNYAVAKSLWDSAHAGFMVTKSTNELPEELGDLFFFFDPYAKDANGDLLWPDLNIGDNHAATFHAQHAVQWYPYPKPQATHEVVDDGTFSYLEIGDPVSLKDAKLTADAVDLAWICEITQLPKTKDDPHRIRFGLIFKPGALSNLSGFDTIDELGATDYLDEIGGTDFTDDGG